MSDNPTFAPAAPLAARFTDLLWGYQRTQLLYAAAVLGLADLLEEGPRSVTELAVATETDAPSLARLLWALTAHGLFTERDDGQFALNPLAALLRTDTADSLRAMVLAEAGDLYPIWGALLHSVRTGETAFEHLHGMTNWEYRAQHPEVNARFNAYMGDLARQKVAAVLANYPFPDAGMVVDVGGGDGTLLIALLTRYPGLRGTLFDLPHVAAAAKLEAAGVAARCAVVGGDFFTAVPTGGDYYILAAVLHDWDDARAADILRQCHRAMPSTATLLLIERVLPDDNSSPVGRLRDMHMLVLNTGGRERTAAEWRAVLADGGFALTALTSAGPAYHVITATPI
jgi:hypothetical protein